MTQQMSTCFKVILSGKNRSWTVWFLVQRWTQKTVKWKKNKHTTPPPQRRLGSHEKTKYSQLSHITKCNTFAKGVTVQADYMLGNVCTDELTSRHFVCCVPNLPTQTQSSRNSDAMWRWWSLFKLVSSLNRSRLHSPSCDGWISTRVHWHF